MDRTTRALILCLFFFSGTCALIYQVVWARMLILVFGVSVYAVSTVLSAFMAGLALGSFCFGRLVDRRFADREGHGLLLYAVLELGIGVFALLFPVLLAGMDEVYTAVYRVTGEVSGLFSLSRFALSFLVLLVPTTLMGATLPVLCKFAVRRLTDVGWDLGRLYAVNTLGAALGALAAAFYLIEAIGVNGTVFVAAAANLLIAAMALWLWRRRARDVAPVEIEAEEGPQQPAVADASRYLPCIVLTAFALSGFAALGYEVVWTRILSTVTQSASAQSLSTILVSFLSGLAAGGAAGARLARRWRDPLLVFAVVELLLGVFGLVSVFAVGGVPLVWTAIAAPSFGLHILRLFASAFAVMLVPTFLMGILFPVVGRLHVTHLRELGSRIGDINAVNTLGAIFGALAAGFLLIPHLGTQVSVDFLAWINIVLGALLLGANPRLRVARKLVVGGGFAVVVLALTLLLPPNMLRQLVGWQEPRSELIHFDEDVGGTVSVHDYGRGFRMLKVNGGSEVPTSFAALQNFRLLGSLPLVLHPSPDEVAVIAFGGGITLAAAEMQGPERIDCVEIVPAVLEAAEHFARENNRVFDRFGSDHLDVIVDDGRNHILRTQRRYDVIISDATHPGTADSWVLYTEEFYHLCRRRLYPGGVVTQWLPLHGLTVDDFRMVLRTFRAVFPHASLWLTESYAVMLGTPDELRIDFELLQSRLTSPAARAAMEEVLLGDAVSYLATLALDEAALAQFVGDGPTNTDDRPYISFTDRKRGGTAAGLPALASLMPHMCESVLPHLVETAAPATGAGLDRRFEARKHTYLGTVAYLKGEWERARRELTEALRVDPGEENAARILKRLRPPLRQGG